MTNLVYDPTFANVSTYWRASNGAVYPGNGIASVDAYMSKYLSGTCGSPVAGDTLTVSAQVQGPLPLTVQLLQGSTVLGSVTQAAATTSFEELTFTAVAPSDAPVTFRVEMATLGPRYSSFRVTTPSVIAPDPVPDQPDGDQDAASALAEALAPRVAAYVGSSDTATAEAQLPVVIEFVKAYVRNKGFGTNGYSPTPALKAVIVSAAARLVTNPEQVSYYMAGDYSEKPAVFSGYTLAEIGVLHTYRRRSW